MLFSTDFKNFATTPGFATLAAFIVRAMNINDMLQAAGTSAMALLSDLEPRQALIRAGAEPDAVDKAHTFFETYYGTCASKRKQREAREYAVANKLGFDRLHAIELAVGRLRDESKAWALRRDLTRFAGNKHDFARHVREKLDHYNRDAPAEQPKNDFKVTSHASTGDASMSIRGSSATIREFEHAVRERAEVEGTTAADAAVDALQDIVTGAAAATAAGAGRPNYTMKILVWLDDIAALLNGDEPNPTVVTNTGATMTFTEAMSKKLNPVVEYVGLTPTHGAIGLTFGNRPLEGWDNAINTRAELEAEQARRAREGVPLIPQDAVDKALSRHGTAKDRALLEANQVVCAGEGCSVPAAYCEINHNIPHSQGGLSVLSNMCLLCKYHNGKAGAEEHYRNVGGIPHRILPGGKLVANYHPLAGLSPPRQRQKLAYQRKQPT